MLTGVNDDLSVAIAQAADQTGTLRKEQLQAIKSRIEQDLDVFENQYSYIAKSGIKGEVSLILERNGEIFIEAEGTKKLVDLLNDKIISQVLDYKEKDGLILSDRIWRITQEAKADITNRISQGMLLGESHAKVAKDLKQYIVGDGGLRYKSERLAMTEMAKAYQRANEQSVEMMRQNSEYMWFEKWELSPAHPKPDVCLRKGTKVETKNGLKNIEDIEIGDEVLTHKGRYRKVTRLYRNHLQNAELRKLTFQSEKNHIHEVVSTPNHPFLIDEEWISAGDLQKGQKGYCLTSQPS